MEKILFLFLVFLAGCGDTDIPPHCQEAFSKAFRKVKEHYAGDFNEVRVKEGALKGMLSSLDPYSTYLSEKDYKIFSAITKGRFIGLGLEISVTQKGVLVISALPDTPAYKAGILPGDLITHINKNEISSLSYQDILDACMGEANSAVLLQIQRKNKINFEKVIKRETIELNPVSEKLIEGNILYIRLTTFNQLATGRLRKRLTTYVNFPLKGIILDLRNNPGGLLEQAINISRFFLKSGVIVKIIGKDPKAKEIIKAKKKSLIHDDIPLVILINKGSASASEIIVGALKDNKRAFIVGENSFGKGSVQTLFPFMKKDYIQLTTAYFYTPSGYRIQGKGIKPDLEIKQTYPIKKDEQLIKAIQVIKNGIKPL